MRREDISLAAAVKKTFGGGNIQERLLGFRFRVHSFFNCELLNVESYS